MLSSMLFTQSNQTINLQTVMATTGPFQRIQAVSPPLKGSFPLDHDSECRSEMFNYMRCLNEKRGLNQECRPLAKLYLGCRMDKGLMERDDWERLGFKDDAEVGKPTK